MLDDIRLTLDEAQACTGLHRREPQTRARAPRAPLHRSSALNDYLDFPGVGQVLPYGAKPSKVNSGKRHSETVYGVTSLSHPLNGSPSIAHWTIEVLDWPFDEDRSRIRNGPRTRLRRFAIGLIKARGLAVCVAWPESRALASSR